MTKLIIFGAGGHAKVVLECARAMQKFDSFIALDDRYPEISNLLDIPVVGKFDQFENFCGAADQAFVAIGDNALRARWLDKLGQRGITLANVIHPSSWVSPSACLGEGVLIAPQAAINAEAIIGLGCIINTGAVVEHDCVVGHNVHIAPHATLAGATKVADLAWIGMGAQVLGGISIGEAAIIGAGSVVREAVLAKQTVAGVPARLLQVS